MRQLKTILIQTAVLIGVFAIIELFGYLRLGTVELRLSEMGPMLTLVLFMTVASVFQDRVETLSLNQTDYNLARVQEWLEEISAKQVRVENDTTHYQVSWMKSIDRDITITTRESSIHIEGIHRLLKEMPHVDSVE